MVDEEEAGAAFDQDGPATEHLSPRYPEEWEGHPYAEEGDLADQGGAQWVEEVDQDSEMPDAPASAPASARRGILSARALALAAALTLVTIGVGAAVLMRSGPMSWIGGGNLAIKADEAQAVAPKAEVAGNDQSLAPTISATGEASSKAGDIPAARPEQPAVGVAASAPAGPAMAAPEPSPAAAQDASSPAAAPALEAPQPAVQLSEFGPQHSVSSLPINPDASSASAPKAELAPPAKPMGASTAVASPAGMESVTPAAKKQADKARLRPSPSVADASEAAKPAKPLARPPLNGNEQVRPLAAPPPPGSPAESLASLFRNVVEGAHVVHAGDPTPGRRTDGSRGQAVAASPAPAPARVAAAPGTTSIARTQAGGGSSVSIKLASSLSERDARETLSRLQKQFPGTLAGGSIYREDLGQRGVFYRVRVGPLPRQNAEKVCSQLRAGGASCGLTGG
ncbi:MAG: SPOR domain-containing protein [Hyphomicrobiales bacterium]